VTSPWLAPGDQPASNMFAPPANPTRTTAHGSGSSASPYTSGQARRAADHPADVDELLTFSRQPAGALLH